jgi:diketogulonate reductase-like aldo/keto reductase
MLMIASGRARPAGACVLMLLCVGVTALGLQAGMKLAVTDSELTLTSTVTLTDGRKLPRLGLGVYTLENGEEAYSAVKDALRTGVRHIDTAELYGNEEAVGRAIRDSGVQREEIWLTTKVWVSVFRQPDYNATIRAAQRSLERLGTPYIDLFLLHSPYGGPERRRIQWQAMQHLKKIGLVKSIGVSNYGVRHLQELEGGAEMPAVNQIELSPWIQRPDLDAYCKSRAIVLTAWGALAPSCHHGQGDSCPSEASAARAEAGLVAMAAKVGVTSAQVLLRWQLQMGHVTLFTTTNHQHLLSDGSRCSTRF